MTAAPVKPNFFIVGAAKCGTTAWFEYLRTHPDIFLPDQKELPHFCTDYVEEMRIADRSDYLQHFRSASGRKAVGEGSVTYLYSATAAREIRQFNPDAKILIFLRDQEDQLPSLGIWMRACGRLRLG